MEIALLVGFSILLALAIAASSLVYSHYIYSKNRLFSKTRYQVLWIIILALVFCITLIGGILFIISKELIRFALACSILSFITSGVVAIYLVFVCLIPTLTNKNKIGYDNILKTDYQTKISELKAKIGDVEALKSKLLTKHNQYYTSMISYYENILKRLKDEKISLVEKQADIVTFNDAFTHKWCTFTNNYQLLLTYQFCDALVKFS